MGLKMDLHIHSTYSDGTMRPVELVKKYQDEEYTIIALTDHESVSGVKEAQIAAEALGVQVIAGTEIATCFENRLELHLLGYYIDVENTELIAGLAKNKVAREEGGQLIDTFDAIQLIKQAGGIATLAHPFKIEGIGEPGSDEYYENLDQILRTLKKNKLGALECFHPSATHEQGVDLVKHAEKFKLHVTQGSDFQRVAE